MDALSSYGAPAYRTTTFDRTVSTLRQQIENSRSEAATGRVSDPVQALGSLNGKRLEMTGTADRIDTIITSNESSAAFLSVVQNATGQIAGLMDGLSQSLVAASGGSVGREFVTGEAEAVLSGVHDVLNTRFGGRSIFGGEETAVPMASLDDARAAFEGIFSTHFGFGSDDPSAGAISGAAMETFIATVALPALTGATWNASLSGAGAPTTVRIGEGVQSQLGPTANEDAFRASFASALIVASLSDSPLGDEAYASLISQGVSHASSASAETAQLQGQTAVVESRIEQVNERLLTHSQSLRESSDEMVTTDAFEAAARFNDLAVKLEAAYAMTGRLQQLTLLRFLP